ncbi:MAG TPA: hypothetical protein VFQ71_02125, partial [Gaiellales bacterium]|nr:hypothetical protein [Gaiellales bacterium]
GVIPPPPALAPARRRPLGLVAFTAVAGLTLVMAVLLLASGQPQVSLVAQGPASPSVLRPQGTPPPIIRGQVLHTSAAAPIEWILLLLAVVALGFAGWLWLQRSRSGPPAAPAR